MSTKTKARKYIDPDAFNLARRKAGLTVKQASIELDVNERTIRNYENGAVQIPYPSFRLMRLLAGYSLLGKQWEDWGFHQNKLWSPEGRSFEAHELRYIATYISLARHFLKANGSAPARADARNARNQRRAWENHQPFKGVSSPSVRPSDATASFGAEVGQAKPQKLERPLGLQEKASNDSSYIREIG